MEKNASQVGRKIASRLQLPNRSSSQAKWQRLDLRGLDKHPNLSTTARLSKTVTNVWSLMLQLAGKKPQHFGPRSRAPDLWPRQDLMYFPVRDLRTDPVGTSPSALRNTLTDAFARVGALEERIGYQFNDRMICVQALKVAAGNPLFFNGIEYPVIRNNRLALLGDRVMNLACCDMWYKSGRSTCEILFESINISC
jgi:hypothetical protein